MDTQQQDFIIMDVAAGVNSQLESVHALIPITSGLLFKKLLDLNNKMVQLFFSFPSFTLWGNVI